jgi:cell wall-associated NlpC family hydrolase
MDLMPISAFLAFHRRKPAAVLCTVAVLCTPALAANAQSAKMFDGSAPEVVPFVAISNSARSLRDSMVEIARAQIGRRYRIGGQAPKSGFDCSGLVRYVLSGLNVEMPRTARLQAKVGLALPRDTSQLLPGDLLTFARSKKGVSHIAIYTGGGHYIHASKRAGKVIETSFVDRPHSILTRIWFGARRIPALDDTTSTVIAGVPPKAGSPP